MQDAQVSARMQALVRGFSWLTRLLPSDNKLLRNFLLLGSGAFDPYRFDFLFRCPRIGVIWSAEAFPEQFTRHMIFDGLYQHDVLFWIKRLCKPGDTVFDVGAFHGLMTVVASKAVKTKGKVVAFEPNERSRQYLQRHLSLNRCRNVIVEPMGLMDAEQALDFYPQGGHSSWNSSFVREFIDPSHIVQPVRIFCTSLDAYVSRTGLVPRFIKIDTEGTEFLILKGATKTILEHRPILLMEFNPKSAEKAGTSIEEILEFLGGLGYETRVVPAKRYGGYNFRVQVPYSDHVPTLEGLANVACVPPTRHHRD